MTQEHRVCGPCLACCTVLGVREINKPDHTPCPHAAVHKGCTIYKDRPTTCQIFSCAWLQGHLPGKSTRPDHSGIIFWNPLISHQGMRKLLLAHEVHAGAHKRPTNKKLIHKLVWSMKNKKAHEAFFMILATGERIKLYPDHDIEAEFEMESKEARPDLSAGQVGVD